MKQTFLGGIGGDDSRAKDETKTMKNSKMFILFSLFYSDFLVKGTENVYPY